VPAYVANCKNCGRRFELDWDGDRRLLPVAGFCSFCAYQDGYGEDEALLVGAFEVVCPACEESFNPDIPAKYIDYSQPTGLTGPLELTCKVCQTTSAFPPEEVHWLGTGASMPEGRALGVGQQRP
jgi:hypothetical protein